jgi:hypothetical protein
MTGGLACVEVVRVGPEKGCFCLAKGSQLLSRQRSLERAEVGYNSIGGKCVSVVGLEILGFLV